MSRVAALVLAFLILTTWASAEDFAKERLDNWHQWRGPEATGVAPKGDPPTKWNEKTNIKWKAAIPGRGSATPIVWGDQVFIATTIDTGKEAEEKDLPKSDPKREKKTRAPKTYHQFVVLSLDRQTGKVRWQQTAAERVPHEGHHPTHSYAAFSPITDGKFLYVSFGSQGLYCYDLAGKQKWSVDLGRMDTRLGWGEGGSMAQQGDTLIVNWDHEGKSFIVALDTTNGKQKWKMDRDEVSSWATPLIVASKDRTQVIVNGTKRARGYDLASGKVLWECGGQTVNVIPSPVTSDGLVFCMSGYKGSALDAIPLDASGDVTGKTTWHYSKATPYVPSPVLVDGRLYFTQTNNASLSCLEAKTGKVLFDRERLPGLSSLYASPTVAQERIYIPDRDGTTLVLKQSDKLEVLATNKLDEGFDASPAIVGKQLFLRSAKHVYCIESK